MDQAALRIAVTATSIQYPSRPEDRQTIVRTVSPRHPTMTHDVMITAISDDLTVSREPVFCDRVP